MQNDLMLKLASRKVLSKKFKLNYIDGCWPHLNIDNPAGVARLIGEAKFALKTGRIFLRGQVEQHYDMRPSLFRANCAAPETLREAEKEFVNRIHKKTPEKRFHRENLPALLQHYGFRTSWLDAVDNLFVAAWFATHDLQVTDEDSFINISSPKEHSWLFLIASRNGSKKLKCVDLRTEHHPLSTRPHIQHGVSLTRLDSEECDMRDFVVATVRIPTDSYSTSGGLFKNDFIFPPRESDHTLRLLITHGINDIAAEVEKQFNLPQRTLGRASELRLA